MGECMGGWVDGRTGGWVDRLGRSIGRNAGQMEDCVVCQDDTLHQGTASWHL